LVKMISKVYVPYSEFRNDQAYARELSKTCYQKLFGIQKNHSCIFIVINYCRS